MKTRLRLIAISVLTMTLALALIGCTPIERQAYDTVVAARAFLDQMRTQHPECGMTPAEATVNGVNNSSILCLDIRKAVAAKDSLIDAIEVYCAGPAFESGGACQPPAKGTPAATQALDKLAAAISSYNQTAADIKSVVR